MLGGACLLVMLAVPLQRAEDTALAEIAGHMRELYRHMSAVEEQLRQQYTRGNERIDRVDAALLEMGRVLVAIRQQPGPSVAGAFLAGPPPSSPLVGVAPVAVFAPHVAILAGQRRDVVVLKVKRVLP